MPNFTPIAFLDTWEVAGSLYGGNRIGLFRKGEPSILPLRGPAPNADNPDDELAFGNYRQTLGKWPEMKRLIDRLRLIAKPKVGEVELGLVFLELLQPGEALPWMLSDSAYTARHHRMHLPIRTNPGARMYAGPEAAHVFQNEVTIVNQLARHSAANFGEWPRIHLVVDFRPRESSEKQI